MSRRILIIEDDFELRKMLVKYLAGRGAEITEASDGQSGAMLLESGLFDIVLLDMMLPYRSGEELLSALRKGAFGEERKVLPVIVISAKTALDTRLETLTTGADDYITKPFDMDEVWVRIETVLRRVKGGAYTDGDSSEGSRKLTYGRLLLDRDASLAIVDGERLKLTSKEFSLLELFLLSPKKTFTKANLYESVWEEEYLYEDNTINVHISNLRKKLQQSLGFDPIDTVWGIGYRLKTDGGETNG